MAEFLLFLIVVATLAGSAAWFVHRRATDRCLALLRDFPVVLEFVDSDPVWGRLRTEGRDLEVLFPRPAPGPQGRSVTGTLVPHDQRGSVRALVRFHDELSDRDLRRRQTDLAALRNPSVEQRLQRTAVDTIESLIHGRESLMARYRGHPVVVEESTGTGPVSLAGTLGDISHDWLLLLDHRTTATLRLPLREPERLRINRDLDFVVRLPEAPDDSDRRGFWIWIENHGDHPVRVREITGPGVHETPEVEIEPRASREFAITRLPDPVWEGASLEDAPAEVSLRGAQRGAGDDAADPARLPDLTLVLELERVADLCLPRLRAAVRHGGEMVV